MLNLPSRLGGLSASLRAGLPAGTGLACCSRQFATFILGRLEAASFFLATSDWEYGDLYNLAFCCLLCLPCSFFHSGGRSLHRSQLSRQEKRELQFVERFCCSFALALFSGSPLQAMNAPVRDIGYSPITRSGRMGWRSGMCEGRIVKKPQSHRSKQQNQIKPVPPYTTAVAASHRSKAQTSTPAGVCVGFWATLVVKRERVRPHCPLAFASPASMPCRACHTPLSYAGAVSQSVSQTCMPKGSRQGRRQNDMSMCHYT